METDQGSAQDRKAGAFPPGAGTRHRTDFQRPVYCLLGLPFDAISMPEAIRRIRAATESRSPCFLSTPNLNFLVGSRRDPEFRNSVLHSDLSVADGMPLVWLARLLDVPIPERVAGADLFEELRQAAGGETKIFFFGGPHGTAQAASERVNSAGGGVRCVGHLWPGTGSIDEMSGPETIRTINLSGADFVVVALGARKGQSWIEQNRVHLEAPVVAHLGAVVNIAAGTVARAPGFLRRIGFEWLWRIKEEPLLWRRYVGDGAYFALLILTRVVPAKIHCVLHNVLRRSPPADLELDRDNGAIHITISGSWLPEDLPTLRNMFESIADEAADIRVDLGGVTGIDAGFVGTLMLLYGHQSKVGRTLRIVAASGSVRRAIALCCAEFLLAGLDAPAGAKTERQSVDRN